MDLLRVLSLNCHGFNKGIEKSLQHICCEVDVILLQETWLSDFNNTKLDSISDSFTVFHTSAMQSKLSSGLLAGRPFGGTAVLVHKRLAIVSVLVSLLIIHE